MGMQNTMQGMMGNPVGGKGGGGAPAQLGAGQVLPIAGNFSSAAGGQGPNILSQAPNVGGGLTTRPPQSYSGAAETAPVDPYTRGRPAGGATGARPPGGNPPPVTRPPVGPLANAAAALVNNRQPPGARPERRPPVSGGPLPGGPPVSGGPPPGWLPGQSMNDEANPFSGSPPSSGGFAGFGSPMSQFFGQTAPTMAGAPAPLPGLGGGFGPGMLQALGLGGVMPHAANPFAAPTPPPQNRPGTGAWGIGGASGGAPGGNAGGTPFAGSSGGFGGAAFGGGPQGSPFNQLFLQQLMGVNNNSQLQGVPMTSGGLF